jgi:hypothetical protein
MEILRAGMHRKGGEMTQSTQRERQPRPADEAVAESVPAVAYVYEIRLLDGGSIWTQAQDAATTEAELQTLHGRLGSEPFVRLGDTIVRSEDVRSVQLHEDDGADDDDGLLDNLKRRFGGGRMTSYDTEERTQTRTRGGRAGRGRETDDGPGFADRYVGYGQRPWSETKPFFLTSEFLTLVATIAAIAIAMGASDNFDAPRGFTLIAGLAAAYMIARGLAKSGTRDPNPEYRDRY